MLVWVVQRCCRQRSERGTNLEIWRKNYEKSGERTTRVATILKEKDDLFEWFVCNCRAVSMKTDDLHGVNSKGEPPNPKVYECLGES